MNFKSFFKNKLNITFVSLVAVSIVLLIVARFVSALMGVAVVMFGVSCGFAIPAIMWYRRATDNSKALENIEFSMSESKQLEGMERRKKIMYIVVYATLGIFAAILIYMGLMMYVR